MHVKAYAKINLTLRVLRKRDDGFHDIQTVFHHINLWDDIEIEPTDGPIVMKSSLPFLPTDAKNLCWRAVEAARNELGIRRGAAMLLNKHIPVGAGLGGGSSDAAAVLKALPKLWDVQIEGEQLSKIAVDLGSDIPFFLRSGSAYAEGRGEILHYVNIKLPFWILVAYPKIHVATGWAYREISDRKFEGSKTNGSNTLKDFPAVPIATLMSTMTNDFEEVVFSTYPQVKALKQEILSRGATTALMSGSGSSVFGLFEKEEVARKAAKALQSDNFVSLTEPNFTPPC
jgi:4-diphosphocytidyl-2-C-methyl-D-erythritol kinase